MLLRGLFTRVGSTLITAAVAALVFFAALVRSRRLKDKVDDLESYKATRQRADRADVSDGDADADRDWLRNRSDQY